MQVVHTSFSIPLPHYFPSYSVKKKFSKIQIFCQIGTGTALKQNFNLGVATT